MIEMKKQVTPGETPAQITVSMIDQDLKDGVSKSEMAIKYGIKPWEVDEMFKHPFLKGRRPSRKKALSFTFVDDTEPLNSGDIAVEQAAEVEKVSSNHEQVKKVNEELLDTIVELADPNQVTLEQAIDEAIETVEEVKTELKETEETIVELLSPTEFKTKEDFVDELQELAENQVEEEIQLDEDETSFEL